MRRIAHPLAAVARMATAAALVSTAMLSACQSAPVAQYDEALNTWNARQYAKTLTSARQAQESAQKANDTEVRDKSAYLAGLAAYQLGKMEDASRSFSLAMTSSDKDLAGNATAMMGAVAFEQGRWTDASALYSQAAGMMKGRGAQEARTLADAAEDRARGRRPSTIVGARSSAGTVPGTVPSSAPSSASSTGTDSITATSSKASAPKKVAPATGSDPPPAPAGSLTIVAGTFSSEVAARQKASTLTETAKRAGLTAPRVVPASAPDRRVWIVELGAFSDRDKAESALKKLPATGCVVAPAQRR